jgi:hypothetical protein
MSDHGAHRPPPLIVGMPIIVCTGFSHLIDADKAKAAGIGAFVMKPLTKLEIARTVRQGPDEQVWL